MQLPIMYRHRTLESFFLEASEQFPILLVTGPRQVGKTTFLQKLAAPTRRYVTLDDPLLRALAQNEPALFLQRFQAPLLIDEIQYAPALFSHLKMWVDQNRTAGQFWLTGSQQFQLMQGVSESLAGRVGIVQLLGFSQRELIGHADDASFLPTEEVLRPRDTSPPLSLTALYERIWQGSFPALYQPQPVHRDLFYSSYVQTYLQRDVRSLAHVGDESSFLRFLRSCAARTGQLLNIQDLCRDVDISHATGKRWLSILEASGIIYLLSPFASNLQKRLIKAPKLYFLDTGLAAYLTEWSSASTLEAGAMSGAMLETWVIAEILKSYWHHGKRAPLYFYRDKDGREIDLLIYQDGTLYPIEIKKTAAPTQETIRHFGSLDILNQQLGAGAVVCLASQWLPLRRGVEVVPTGML